MYIIIDCLLISYFSISFTYLDNSNIPDTDYMWEEYSNKPTQIACRLVRGEVCAKFSYTFNGASEL